MKLFLIIYLLFAVYFLNSDVEKLKVQVSILSASAGSKK